MVIGFIHSEADVKFEIRLVENAGRCRRAVPLQSRWEEKKSEEG